MCAFIEPKIIMMRQRIQKKKKRSKEIETTPKNEMNGGKGERPRRNIIDKNVVFSELLFWLLNCGDLKCACI